MPIGYGSVRGRIYRNEQPLPESERPMKISVDGMGVYESVSLAAKALGVRHRDVMNAIRTRKPVRGHLIIKLDDEPNELQQPKESR